MKKSTLCNGQYSESYKTIDFEDTIVNQELVQEFKTFAMRGKCPCYEPDRFPRKPSCPWQHCRRTNCASAHCRYFWGHRDRYFFHDFCQLNLCMSLNGRALSCGISSATVSQILNRFGRIFKLPIPSAISDVIVKYVDCQGRRVYDEDFCGWSGNPTIFKATKGKTFRKMLNVHLERSDRRKWKSRQYLECIHLYLETNGTIWEEIQSGEMIFYEEGNLKIMTYFPNNKIVIKDIALGTGHKYAKCPNPSLCLIVDSAHCLAVDIEDRVYSWGYRNANQYGQCGRQRSRDPLCHHPGLITFPSSKHEEKQSQCISIQCGSNISYVCFRVSAVNEEGKERQFDRHFLFGDNRKNQCFTFDGRQTVETPFCINEIVEERFGGRIDFVFLVKHKVHVVIEKSKVR